MFLRKKMNRMSEMAACLMRRVFRRPFQLKGCLNKRVLFFVQQLADDAVDFRLLVLRGFKVRIRAQAGNRMIWRADEQRDVVHAGTVAAGVVAQIVTAFRFIQALAVGDDIYCFAADAVFGQGLGDLLR